LNTIETNKNEASAINTPARSGVILETTAEMFNGMGLSNWMMNLRRLQLCL